MRRRIVVLVAAVAVFSTLPLLDAAQFGELDRPLGGAFQLPDGGIAVLNGDHSAIFFCSAKAITQWSTAGLPKGAHFMDIAGVCPGGILVRTARDADGPFDPDAPTGHIQVLSSTGQLTELASKIGGHCGFFNAQIGCHAAGNQLLVTLDGGRTWRSAPSQSRDKTVRPSAVKWTGADELLVGEFQTLSALSVTPQQISVRWTVKANSPALGPLPVAGDTIWLPEGDDQIVSLSLRDGTEKTRTRIGTGDVDISGLAADRDHVYLWGMHDVEQPAPGDNPLKQAIEDPGNFLEIWDVGDGVVKRKITRQPTDQIETVAPLGNTAVVIFNEGKVCLLQDGKFTDQALTVRVVGQAAAGMANLEGTIGPNGSIIPLEPPGFFPTEEEEIERSTWERKVSPSELEKVVNEVESHDGLSPRDSALLMTEKCKQISAAHAAAVH